MTKQEIRQYVYAGNSTFHLIIDNEPQDDYYYNVIKRSGQLCYDVYLINTNGLKKCIGKLWSDMIFPFDRTCKEYGDQFLEAIEELANWLNGNIERKCFVTFEKAHTCAKCGMLLTDEESIKRGYGPECWRKMNGEKL